MADTLRDLVVSLSLNSDNFTRNIKSISKQIQEAQSEFRMMSSTVDNFESTVDRKIDELINLKIEIAETINQVRNENYRLILEMRYLGFHTWEQIADTLHYTVRWVRKMHARALDVVDAILKEHQHEL